MGILHSYIKNRETGKIVCEVGTIKEAFDLEYKLNGEKEEGKYHSFFHIESI